MNGRKRHATNVRKVKRLELRWQLYVTWLSVRDLGNFRPLDFCWTEGTVFSTCLHQVEVDLHYYGGAFLFHVQNLHCWLIGECVLANWIPKNAFSSAGAIFTVFMVWWICGVLISGGDVKKKCLRIYPAVDIKIFCHLHVYFSVNIQYFFFNCPV